MIIKLGENIKFSSSNILPPAEALVNKQVAKRFIKLSKKLRKVAPKAKDFIYAWCAMMTAAEKSLFDDDGKPKLNKEGKNVRGWFEEFTNDQNQESIKWVSPDNINPYKNQNGDIFGEETLLKHHKGFIGRPLCRDHVSDSVDGIRGIIIDTHYDRKTKHVYALFALDKKNYGDLAHKVKTGYANSVSMGTGVGRAICTDCHKVAFTEKDYCACIKARSNYGEINLDLSPIELSLVVNGADPAAKIRQIVASMGQYVEKKQTRIAEIKSSRCVNPIELHELMDSISDIQTKLNQITQINKSAEVDESNQDLVRAIVEAIKSTSNPEAKRKLEQQLDELILQDPNSDNDMDEFEPQPVRATTGGGSEYTTPEWADAEVSLDPSKRLAKNRLVSRKKEGGKQGALLRKISLLRSKITEMDKSLSELKSIYSEEKHMNSARLKARAKARRAYWLGGGGVNDPASLPYDKDGMAEQVRDKEDKQMVGEPLETGSEGLHPGDKELKEKLLRAQDLENRRMQRRAYWLGGGGVNEPQTYDKDGMAEQVRDKEDKQMVGEYNMGGTDGMVPGDEETKKKLLRARLKATFIKVAGKDGKINKEASRWDIRAGDKLILTASGSEIWGSELNEHWDRLKSADYGRELLRSIRSEGFDRTAYLLKGAVDPVAPVVPGLETPALPDAGLDELGVDPLGSDVPATEEPEVEVKQEKDETRQKVDTALNTMEEKIAEVRDLITDMGSDELVDIDVNIEDKTEDSAAPVEASPMDGVLAASRNDIMKVEALMDLSADELAEASEMLDATDKVPTTAMNAVKAALQDSVVIISKANIILEAAKDDKDDKDKKDKKDDKKCKKCDCDPCECDKDDKKDKDKKDKKEAQKLLSDALKIRAENRANLLEEAMGGCDLCGDMAHDGQCAIDDKQELGLELLGLDMPADDKKDKKDDKKKFPFSKDDEDDDEDEDDEDEDDEDEDEDDAMFVLEDPAEVFAARKADRDQLLALAKGALGGGYQLGLGTADNATEEKYFEAHPGGKGTVTELTHTKTPEAKVETISEIHDVMRDVAESGPRNVRDAAMQIQIGIVKGALKASDLGRLVAEGKVDAATVSYWKKYWGEGADTGSFGADMSKEFAGKKKEASENNWRAKLRRAFDIGLEAQDKGVIGQTRGALDTYVDELMTFGDAAFESTKRIISSLNNTKKSGVMPIVGMNAAHEAMEVTASKSVGSVIDLDEQLFSLGWK